VRIRSICFHYETEFRKFLTANTDIIPLFDTVQVGTGTQLVFVMLPKHILNYHSGHVDKKGNFVNHTILLKAKLQGQKFLIHQTTPLGIP
jgi:hypothetical protein